MANKYKKLSDHLAAEGGDVWVARFDDIERLLGFALPDSARTYPAWWSNQMRAQSLSWQSVGWKATALDLRNGSVTFVRAEDDTAAIEDDRPRPLTIFQAKAGLALMFGVQPSQIEIVIKG